MNAYTSLLSRAIETAAHNKTSRHTIYQHARKTLVAHLSQDEGVDRERLEDEMAKLDDAIATVEDTLKSLDSNEHHTAGRGRPGAQAGPAGDPLPSTGPAATRRRGFGRRERGRRMGRLLPPFDISGRLLGILQLLSNPYFLIGSLLAGVYVGLFSKTLTALLTPVADIYIELLKMVLIPFMVSAIVVSLSRLLGAEAMKRHLGPIFGIFIGGLVLAAALGVLVSVVASPGGNISGSTRQALGQVINSSAYAVDIEIALNHPNGAAAASSGGLLDRLIPDNIFHALTAGENLKILFFAIAFGIGLGSLQASRGEGLRSALLSVYDVCTKLIAWVNTLLPLALCGMVAKQVATVGTAELVAMIKFTIGFGAASVVLLAVSVALMAWASGAGVMRAIRAAREPLLLAVATRSSITCIPSAMRALTANLDYEQERVELLLPLGITLFRFGPVVYYAFTTMFVAQLYGITISPSGYLVIAAGAVLAGLASAGTTGVLTISLLGVIFQPLGLPLEAALALLVTVDPVIDIFRTASIVIANCAAVAVVYRRRGGDEPMKAPVPDNVLVR